MHLSIWQRADRFPLLPYVADIFYARCRLSLVGIGNAGAGEVDAQTERRTRIGRQGQWTAEENIGPHTQQDFHAEFALASDQEDHEDPIWLCGHLAKDALPPQEVWRQNHSSINPVDILKP